MCQTACKLHSLRLVDAQLSRGGGPVIAAPVRAESELPNAAQRQIRPERQKAKKALPARQNRTGAAGAPKTTTDIAMARQRQTGSYTWTQVKSVQNLIERCLSQYMTQAEV